MMGIQEDSESPAEAKKPLEKNRYIVVKNHVREIHNQTPDDETNNQSDQETNIKLPKDKKNKKQTVSSSDSEVNASGICENDLEELRTVYNKCKVVMKKIETKYGHLLQLDEESSKNRKRRLSSSECQCIFKKKIIYDDEGKQVYQDVVVDHHICPSNFPKPSYSIPNNPENLNLNLNIENETSYELPDDLQELAEILKDPKLSKYIQYQVTQKIKSIREENSYTLRFDKPNLIKKLKSNCDDILEFKGSNLFSLPGYPVDKIE